MLTITVNDQTNPPQVMASLFFFAQNSFQRSFTTQLTGFDLPDLAQFVGIAGVPGSELMTFSVGAPFDHAVPFGRVFDNGKGTMNNRFTFDEEYFWGTSAEVLLNTTLHAMPGEYGQSHILVWQNEDVRVLDPNLGQFFFLGNVGPATTVLHHPRWPRVFVLAANTFLDVWDYDVPANDSNMIVTLDLPMSGYPGNWQGMLIQP